MSYAVAKRSDRFEDLCERLHAHRALWNGTHGMRDAGDKFLPRFEAEDEKDYRRRLDRSFLFNGYRKAIKDMVGRVFEKPVTLDNPDGRLGEWMEDVNLEGQHLSNFAVDVFEDAIAAGISYIFVDAPRREGTVTVAQAQSEGLRPYFVHVTVEQILGIKTDSAGGRTVLSQLRLMECVEEEDPQDEFANQHVQQVRVLDRAPEGVFVRIYREVKDGIWAETEDSGYVIPVPEIRLVPVYTNRCGFMIGEPLMQDLADMNVAHWQSDSDQRHILHVARVPILWGAGWQEEDTITIGASVAQLSANEMAKLQYAEHSGAAINSGREDIKDLEFRMQALGLQLLVQSDKGQGATGAVLDAKKEMSPLAMLASNLEDALQQAIDWMADFGGVPSAEVSVHKDFAVLQMTAQEFQQLLMAVNTGQVSRETFLSEIKRRGWVSDSLDVDEEMERLDEGALPETQAPDTGSAEI